MKAYEFDSDDNRKEIDIPADLKEAAEADQKLLKKRQELMKPILQRLDENLKYLADGEGYDYILNSVDGNGVTIVLRGPEEHDLTEKLMKKLGIENE